VLLLPIGIGYGVLLTVSVTHKTFHVPVWGQREGYFISYMEGSLMLLKDSSYSWSQMMKNSKANGISRKRQPQPQKCGGGIIIKAEIEEIRVCTNRTCRKQGSIQTLQTLSAIAPPNVTINSCACLGRCGSGPNLIALPNANPVIVGHCGTAARAAQIMVRLLLCDHNDDDAARLSLEALALSKTAQSELDQSNFSQAELLLSQAIDLKPFGGIHILHKDRSRARLALGNYSGALEDAREALKFAPQYTEVSLA
jgi:tetratricopeptide (TPR) repeat protein